MGHGGQRKAQEELGWNRDVIRKGTRELESGFRCDDNFSARGRLPAEKHLQNLLEDIQDIVEPLSQADPTFKTTNEYSPITAPEVRRRLIGEKQYSDEELPCVRTIQKKMNELNFRIQKVQKCKQKKIPETDKIFNYVHTVNKIADATEGIIRISIDTKTGMNVGRFSRGGFSRLQTKALDHDYKPETTLKPFGISLPALNENHIYFTESNVTADFMVDALEDLWPSLKERFDPHTIVINSDNGPENSSRRSQFMKRLIEFACINKVNISLAYYPPYHSKYNPIERVWGVLKNHLMSVIYNTRQTTIKIPEI